MPGSGADMTDRAPVWHYATQERDGLYFELSSGYQSVFLFMTYQSYGWKLHRRQRLPEVRHL